MSRRSLRPQLNQIRAWVRQGRTDAWIAHQLDVTVQQIQAFKREQDLETDGAEAPGYDEEVDLRAEDDAAIAAELEQEAARRAEEEAARRAEEEAAAAARAEEEAREAEEAARRAEEAEGEEDEAKPRRARRTRGGRSRRRSAAPRPLEGTFDHGEEGYGLWLDPAVQDDPVYAEHWAGHRPIEITIDEDQIVIRRAGGGEDDED
jgi:septal ring factor EnvC (AmiA/AmiB activator)